MVDISARVNYLWLCMCRYMRIGRKQGRWVELWRKSDCKTVKLFFALEVLQVMVVRYEVVWGGTCKTVLLQAYRSRNAVIAYYNLFYNVKLHTMSPNYLHTAALNNSVPKWSRDLTPHKKIISTGSETVRTIIIRGVNLTGFFLFHSQNKSNSDLNGIRIGTETSPCVPP